VTELYTPFRPRLARVVTLAIGVLLAVGTVVLITLLPRLYDRDVTLDLVGIGLVGLFGVWFCWRQASVVAVPDDHGLYVRNLIFTRRLEWAEIVLVRFGQGRAWAQLDLSDGDTLAVMGIQRSDGARAEQEATRLATLVQLHGAAGSPGDPPA